jgi:hypothetical protein
VISIKKSLLMVFSICCLINSFISKADDTFFQSASPSINQQQSMINLSSNTAFSSSTYNDFFTPHNIIQTYHQPPPIETCPHTCPITNQCTYNQGSNLGLSYSFDIWVAVIFDTYQQFHVPTPYPQPTTTCGDHWYTVCEPPKPPYQPPVVDPDCPDDPVVCTAEVRYCPGTQTVMPRDLTTCRWQTEKCQNDPVVCTTEVRYCPGTQTVMPRDLTTCRWQTEKCQNDPVVCTTEVRYCPGTQTVMPRDLTTCRWQEEKCTIPDDPIVCSTNIIYCPGTKTVMPRDLTTCRWQTEKCQNDPRTCVCPYFAPNCGSLGSWNESYTLKCQNGLTAKCFQTHCGGKPESYL